MLRINQRFLTEERGARGRGIPRGSVGAHDDTAICGGSTLGARAPVREISAYEAAERAAYLDYRVRDESRIAGFVRGSEYSEPALNRERVRQRIGDDFARWQGERAERFDTVKPADVRAGPTPKRIQRAVKAEERRVERAAEQVQRDARAGLDMRDPRQARRAKAREERAQQRAAESPLNRYARETREIGRTGTV